MCLWTLKARPLTWPEDPARRPGRFWWARGWVRMEGSARWHVWQVCIESLCFMTLLLYGTLADDWALCALSGEPRLAIHRISYTPLLFRHLLSHRARRWRRSYPVAMKWCAEFGQWIGHIFTTRIRGVTATCIVSYEGSYHRGKHQHTGYNTQKKAALDHGSCRRECRS